MTVKRDAANRRSVSVEVEVPGTPEDVWEAIATGPGISAWFSPAEVEGREDGAFRCRPPGQEGPGIGYTATVTVWDPPRRFGAEGPGFGPGAPPVAAVWTIEPRSSGRCIVRVVHSLFASTDDWDDELKSVETGWPTFFLVLRLYLEHFRGRPASIIRAWASTSGPVQDVWRNMTDGLGITGAAPGGEWSFEGGGLRAAGMLHRAEGGVQPYAVFRLDQPAPGILTAGAFPMDGRAHANLGIHLYGAEAAAIAARDAAGWRAWITARFP